jgi:hypothetical protein
MGTNREQCCLFQNVWKRFNLIFILKIFDFSSLIKIKYKYKLIYGALIIRIILNRTLNNYLFIISVSHTCKYSCYYAIYQYWNDRFDY